MTKVITYGTYDLLHRGHIRLLERARALGDYLIVGITSDDYDKTRGKINAAQSLMERIEGVKALGIADEIIVEEYEGQKIDDIRRFGVDIFTVGSDWKGKFDYLNEYCKVIYLPRTEGVSSSEIRAERRTVKIGFVGQGTIVEKYKRECQFVNGLAMADYTSADAVYIQSHPRCHVVDIQKALEAGKHVLCESPIALSGADCRMLFQLAEARNLVLMDAIKTAYSTAYNRMLLLVKSGKIGRVVSVDATCTSLSDLEAGGDLSEKWNARQAWAPTALLAVMQILGVDYDSCNRTSFCSENNADFDIFSRYNFRYPGSVASVTVGKGVKSEGELIVAGTRGYVYVPAPWWKTDYFEVRYENPEDNRRYFYQLDGEGIRYELVAFIKAICNGRSNSYVPETMSQKIAELMK